MGVPFDRVTASEAVARIARDLEQGRGGWALTPNLEILRRLVREPANHDLLEAADLVLADGMPLVWASRVQRTPLPERVAGSDLAWSVPRAAAERGASVFLLGGEPGAAEDAAARLRDEIPGLEVAGTLCPEHGFDRDPGRVAAVIEEVTAAQPRVVLVGLGFPKQERLIQRLRADLPAAWMLGVGISLSFVAGDVRRAPPWMQAIGLEWVHRFWQEPGRLARRYLVHGLPFAARLFAHAARVRTAGDQL
jgi:N-acetylglucosaminyldiphosphoundecaprenol N-acetyl-beta-D-mannosaminyltransferase